MAFTLDDVLRKSREIEERASRPTLDWFSLGKGKKNPIRVRFLQEFTTESRNYDSTRGTVVFLNEHTSPHDFKRRAKCSMDAQGRCFACEMVKAQPEGVTEDGQTKYWGAKSNMYVYLATEDGEVKVLSRPAPGPFFNLLHSFHKGDGENSITEQEFEIAKGPNRNDSWTLTPRLKQSFELPDLSQLADLESAVGRDIAYDEQKNFYIPVDKKDVLETKEASSTQASPNNFDW